MKWFDVMKKEPTKDLRIVAAFPTAEGFIVFCSSAVFTFKQGVLEEVEFIEAK